MYEDLSLLLFITGYLAIVDRVKPTQKEVMLKHPRELMANTESYRWKSVRAFHVLWFQQLKKSRADWGDEDKKLEFRRALMWNPSHWSSLHKAHPMAAPWQKVGKEDGNMPVKAKLAALPTTEESTWPRLKDLHNYVLTV